jgi:hypothetical protein
MAFVVNPGQGKDLASYINAARGAQSSSPAMPFGGESNQSGSSTTTGPAPTKTGAAGIIKGSVGGLLGAFGLAMLLA